MERENLRLWKEKITTTGLIAINIFLFVICLFSGELLYSEGAFSLRYLLQGREWWRLVTSMFLHADVDHLVGNMLMLYLAGELVERYVGKRKFVILYFFSGAAGSLFYALYEYLAGDYADSIGASGAVFGVVGALFIIVACHRGRYGSITMGRMIFMLLYMIYMGFQTSNVNNAAHIGGLFGGILLTGIYVLAERKKERGYE